MKRINKEELIKKLVKIGVTGIDKPWSKMTTSEKVKYVTYIDPKRAKDVDVAKIARLSDRAYFISQFPNAANRYDINKFGSNELSVYLISKVPSLLKKLNKNKIAQLDWGRILPYQPQLSKYCDFTVLSASDWARILRRQPQFIDRFDPARFTSVDDWFSLLYRCPTLWSKCPFDSFTREDKLYVARNSMHLLKKLDFKSFSRKEWLVVMGCICPENEAVNVWIASELKRLSGQLKLPK